MRRPLGYAEANPELDVGGGGPAHKLALLTALAFGVTPDLDAVAVQGIRHITPDEHLVRPRIRLPDQAARYCEKERSRHHPAVQPAMVRAGTPLADVDGVLNGVVVNANEAGPFFLRAAARECPTANAVLPNSSILRGGNVGQFWCPCRIIVSAVNRLRRVAPRRHFIYASRCWMCLAYWRRSPAIWRSGVFSIEA